MRGWTRAPTPEAAAFEAVAPTWGERYPAVVRLGDNPFSEFIPFLDYHLEIRRVLSTTSTIESLNAATGEP